jgi:hypothetical protein
MKFRKLVCRKKKNVSNGYSKFKLNFCNITAGGVHLIQTVDGRKNFTRKDPYSLVF